MNIDTDFVAVTWCTRDGRYCIRMVESKPAPRYRAFRMRDDGGVAEKSTLYPSLLAASAWCARDKESQ